VGIVDTISAGLRLVFRRPWLALLPLLLDVFLWRGPKLSMAPAIEQLLVTLRNLSVRLAQSGDATASVPLENLITLLQDTVADTNLFGMLVWGNLGVPSLSGALPIEAVDRVIELSQVWQLIPLQASVLAVGLLLAAVFLCLLGNSVRNEPFDLTRLGSWVAASWVKLAIVLLVVGMGLFSALAVSVILGPLALIILLGLLWILLYISFFPQAITLAGHSAWGAVVSSYYVVRTGLWPTLGLLLITNLLSAGLGLVWQRLMATAPAGMLVAIIANALVGTGLTAALFIFYRDRLVMLQDMVNAHRSTEAT
jgi:hypothetical protein